MNPYKDNMQQKWIYGKTSNIFLCEEYGFKIIKSGKYFLYWNDTLMIHTYSLEAAKEISLVLINDRIMHA